jgi:hypothetical protein
VGVIAGILTGAAAVLSGLYHLQTQITEAARNAEQAIGLARKAGEDMQSVRTQVDGALVTISSRLGRIEGLLENLTGRQAPK